MSVNVGLDDIAVHIPALYLPMQTFAALRNQDFGKLSKGLGLLCMSVPDVHQDPATMAAMAVSALIDRNGLDPRRIGRLYLGTESALDGAKPTATYILQMLTQRYGPQYGADCFGRCDVVDLTFACIGAVDALHNTLDWVAQDPERIGVVAFADNAKYERGSAGEYTQGAGGGAMLVTHSPRLLQISPQVGVSTRPVHDFYKPRRELAVRDLLSQVLNLAAESGAQIPAGTVDQVLASLQAQDSPLVQDEVLSLHKDTPLFDGPLSNRCYREAVKLAFTHFREQAIASGRLNPETDPVLTEQWARVVLHLPYAFQGKRMFPDLYHHDRHALPEYAALNAELGPAPSAQDFERVEDYERASEDYRRRLSKTATYRSFVAQRIERGQRASSLVGNQYTGSLFLALMSTLECDLAEGNAMAGERIGFCAYGSGAKSKVFEGTIQPGWKEIVARFKLFEGLEARQALNAEQYEALHRRAQANSIRPPQGEFVLERVGQGAEEGQRFYRWVG